MKNCSKIFSLLLSIIFVINFNHVLGNKKQDIIVFQRGTGCPPGLIKTGGGDHHGGDIIAIAPCTPPKKKKMPEMPKIEYVPLPYPVKKYIPYPVIKEKPIIVEVEKKEMEMPMEMPMHMPMEGGMDEMPSMADMGDMYDMEMGYGMDSKKSVTHTSADQKADKKSDNKQNKKKIVKNNRKENRNSPKSEKRHQRGEN